MLNTITINDDVNYIVNKVVGRKPAKMGGLKVNTLINKAREERLKIREAKQQTVNKEEKVEEKVVTKQVEEPKKPVENVPKTNKVVKFPTIEEYQTRLTNKGVVCYNNVLGNLNAKAARKLRVDSNVVDYQNYVTKNVSVMPQPIVKEEVKTFDFSTVLNQPTATNETQKPSIDDYFKKENDSFIKPVEEKVEKTPAEIVDIEEIRRKKELLNEKNENINKIELSIQEAEERRLKLKQQLALVNQDLDNQLETTEDKELEKTMQLNKIQAEIIKMSELLSRGNQNNYEYEDTYGGKAI